MVSMHRKFIDLIKSSVIKFLEMLGLNYLDNSDEKEVVFS